MRSHQVKIRNIEPDLRFNHQLVTKIINRSMINGKKSAAQKQVYAAMELIKTRTDSDPLSVLIQALENIKPQMEVRSRRIGGAAYQIPVPVRAVRKDSLAVRWLIESAKSRPNTDFRTFADKLSAEILDASNNTGLAIKKKLDTHRMAEANKAFAHFRW